MPEVWFYHLTETPAEDLLPVLLLRALVGGHRIELRGTAAARMDRLDQALWLQPADGFLPHGLAGGPQDARQPVLLTVAGQTATNGADFLVALDGAEVTAEECASLFRAAVVFDGNDPASLATARDQWRLTGAAGLAAQYWTREGGRWTKKQERAAQA